ncbi:MAG TPA: hypothetical protein VN108_04685 [Marmoricola sp.]|nr:hypothetical protein [Marmoricola sp.]
MKRFSVSLLMLMSVMVPLGAVAASPASASCRPPDGDYGPLYVVRDPQEQLTPTNVYSTWTWPRYNTTFTVTYDQTKTEETNASLSASVELDEGVIFAQAKETFGVSVGRSWSHTEGWHYTATFPADGRYDYRAHLYHVTWTFHVMRYNFDVAHCRWVPAWSRWQTVSHAPVKSSDPAYQEWTVDRRRHP